MNLSAFMQPRKLLAIDLTCALSAGVIYLLLFDWMVEFLSLPTWVAQMQLCANLTYGFYGASIFIGRSTNRNLFRVLVGMNALYALFCIVVSSTLFLRSAYGAASLLLLEGGVIMTLAMLERNSWFGPSGTRFLTSK